MLFIKSARIQQIMTDPHPCKGGMTCASESENFSEGI